MVDRHTHNGTDSEQIFAGDLMRAPQPAPTTANTDNPGASYTATTRAVIENLQTRVTELEEKLQALGLIL